MIKKIRLSKHFRASKKLYQARKKINDLIKDRSLPVNVRRKLMTADRFLEAPRSLLDDHYHEIITNAEFNKYGHIYYNAEGKAQKRGRL